MKKEYYQGKNFWREERSWHYAPLTDTMIHEAERQLKVKLPYSYIKLLKEQNGGIINYPYFSDSDHELVWMHSMEGIDLEDIEYGNGILASKDEIEERGLPISSTHAVILWTDFHYYVALDYSNTLDNPPVVYFWETYEEENPWGVRKLAPNFDSFLSQLFKKLPLDPTSLKARYSRRK